MLDLKKRLASGFPICPAVSPPVMISDEALRNAQDALALYADSQAKEGRGLPAPRAVSALKNDPDVAADLREHTLALIALPVAAEHAAE